MTCVCGYETIGGYYSDDKDCWIPEDGDHGLFLKSKLDIVILRDDILIDYDLYICPKCGTLKINI